MTDSKETTTIEVTAEIWAALDKRKERGDSFDTVIRKLINQTDAPVGAIKEDAGLELLDVRPAESEPGGATCSHYDTILGETCGKPAEYIETLRYEGGEEQEFYFCEDHVARKPEE